MALVERLFTQSDADHIRSTNILGVRARVGPHPRVMRSIDNCV
jgi:hypothetical protein